MLHVEHFSGLSHSLHLLSHLSYFPTPLTFHLFGPDMIVDGSIAASTTFRTAEPGIGHYASPTGYALTRTAIRFRPTIAIQYSGMAELATCTLLINGVHLSKACTVNSTYQLLLTNFMRKENIRKLNEGLIKRNSHSHQ